MSALTLTGRVVETPHLSRSSRSDRGRPDVRTTFEIAGVHSGARLKLHATEALAERIVTTLVAGDVITVTVLDEGTGVRFVESYTVHPKDAA